MADSCDIFISYRRKDVGGHARALHRDLYRRFDKRRIFFDRRSVESGQDFPARLSQAVSQSRAFLALIGPGWIDVKDQDGRPRIEDPSDFVHREIATALTLNKTVIPVLLDDAQMPPADRLPVALRGLAAKDALTLRGKDFEYDTQLAELVRLLAKVPGMPPPRPPEAPWPGPGSPGATAVLLGLLAYGVAVGVEHGVLGLHWLDAWRDTYSLATAGLVLVAWALLVWRRREWRKWWRSGLAAFLLVSGIAVVGVAVWTARTYSYRSDLGLFEDVRWRLREDRGDIKTYEWTFVSATAEPGPFFVTVTVRDSCPKAEIRHFRPRPVSRGVQPPEEVAAPLRRHREWWVPALHRPHRITFALTVANGGEECIVPTLTRASS
jgi:hypothetical protein